MASIGTTSVSNIICTWCSSPSDKWYKAQLASVRVSASAAWCNAFTKTGIAAFTDSKFGSGLPRHKFERAQIPCFIILFLFVLATSKISSLSALVSRTSFLNWWQSPAIFPKAQIPYLLEIN